MAQNSKWFENDIRLPLTPSQKKLVEEWLPKFIEARRNHFGVPRVVEDSLEIGAPDLMDFLSFTDMSDQNQFLLRPLRKLFFERLSSILNCCEHDDQRTHYSGIFNLARPRESPSHFSSAK